MGAGPRGPGRFRRRLAAAATLGAAAVALLALPAPAPGEHGGGGADAGCSPDGVLAVEKGNTFSISVGYANGTGSTVTYTATMLENDFFGPAHTFHTQTVGAGLGVNVNFDFISTASFPTTTDRVVIEITSSGTGSTVLGKCDFFLIVGPDTDGDALFDNWETTGLDLDGGGVELTLPGADPQRKDVYVEVDCLVASDHGHCPRQNAIQDVVQAFANAPAPNPDGTTGVQLHIDTGSLYGAGTVVSVAGTGGVTGTYGDLGGGGDQFPEAGNEIIDWDGATGNPATSFYSLKNLDADRAFVYRYAIFGHQTNARAPVNDCTSGWAEGIPGNDFMVTLGGLFDDDGDGTAESRCWGGDGNGFSVGSRAQQAGTFMHEFGHVIGLGHGGGDGVNRKPNYLSVMSYAFQMCGVPAAPNPALLPGGCDFSRDDLPDLVEDSPPGLDECAGVNDPYGFGQMDWDGDGVFEGATCAPASANVSVDINDDDRCVGDGPDDVLDTMPAGDDVVAGSRIVDGPNFTCDTAAAGDDDQVRNVGDVQPTPLAGFDDWDGLVYDFRGFGTFANGVADPVEDEADPQTIQEARESLQEVLAPDLQVTKTGPTDAIPGDVLTYTLTVTNLGPGPAFDVVLTDTRPDGSTAVFDLGDLTAGSTETRTVTFTVPFPIVDETVLTNTATATGKDMLGEPEATPANNIGVATTIVHTPVLEVAKSAPASVAAGAAVLYTLTYANTGSGNAADVVVTDTVPAGSYYSLALDLGAGPKPDAVTPNADGTTTLRWNVGALPAASGPQTITYTTRPSLLALAGDAVVNDAEVDFSDANGNDYPAVAATTTTSIVAVTPRRDVRTIGFWRNHSALWTDETLARVQATDQRYDGDADGSLEPAEVGSALAPGGGPAYVLREQLLATLFNLATRRVNAGTPIASKTAEGLGLDDVREAVIYAQETLALPLTSATRDRYSNAIRVLDEINNGRGLAW